MTQTMLAIIGIVLAALAALITIDYGGRYHAEAQHRANAATLQTAGENVLLAYRMYELRFGSKPANLNALNSPPSGNPILKEFPLVRDNGTLSMAWSSRVIGGSSYRYMTVTGVPEGPCGAVNLRANGFANPEIIPNAPNFREGCFNNGSQNVYYRHMEYP